MSFFLSFFRSRREVAEMTRAAGKSPVEKPTDKSQAPLSDLNQCKSAAVNMFSLIETMKRT